MAKAGKREWPEWLDHAGDPSQLVSCQTPSSSSSRRRSERFPWLESIDDARDPATSVALYVDRDTRSTQAEI